MPIYEYMCLGCGQHCEVLQKFSDKPETRCPHCHKEKLERQISAASFHLKGSGWYVTDFKDQGNKPAAAKESATHSDETPKTAEATKEVVKSESTDTASSKATANKAKKDSSETAT